MAIIVIAIIPVPAIVIPGLCRDPIVGHIGGNVIALHDVLHAARIFCNVVAIIAAAIVYSFSVSIVEVPLVFGRKASLVAPITVVLWIRIAVSPLIAPILRPVAVAGDAIVGDVRRDVVALHDVLHLACIFVDIIAVVLTA